MIGTVAKRLRAEARKVSEPSKIEVMVHNFYRKIEGRDILSRSAVTCYYSGYKRVYRDMKKEYI